MNITRLSNLNFKSFDDMEAINRKNRELELARLRAEQELIAQIDKYPPLDNKISADVAKFLSQFTCATQIASEHNIMEFFGSDDTAAELRKNLSPECQKDSIKLREMIQNMEEINDPVKTLIVANRIKEPRAGFLSDEQCQNFVNGIKKALSTTIRNANLDQFDAEDKASILLMTQKIEESEGINFGIETQLKNLIDKLNKKKLNIGFIPPVQVKELNMQKTINMLKK